MTAETPRYTAVAIVLHWAIAVGILAMVPFGWWMGDALYNAETRAHGVMAFQLHKSIGLTILVLSLMRLGWRLTHKPPPLPAGMPAWERLAAQATHVAFYVLMIGLPLSGWVYVSTGFTWDGKPLDVATQFFGLFTVPDLPIAAAPDETRKAAALGSINAHSKLAWAALILAGLHVAAALKHHFVHKDNVLAGMVPGVPAHLPMAPARPGRGLALGIGLGAVALAAIAAVLAVATWRPAPAPAPLEAPAVVEDVASAETIAPPPTQVAASSDASAAQVEPARWTVAPRASAIRFSGSLAGAGFEGRFSEWRADIQFDPAALDRSRVRVEILTATVEMDDATQASTLRQPEWLDSVQHEQAVFEARRFRALGGDRFEAAGSLRLKDRDIPLTLPFTLRIEGDRARMEGRLTFDRTAANVGMVSDPGADWVSREIVIDVRVEASRAP